MYIDPYLYLYLNIIEPSVVICNCIHIYIYIYRERKRCISTWIYISIYYVLLQLLLEGGGDDRELSRVVVKPLACL